MIARIRKWTPATMAVALTMLRRSGLVEMVDPRCEFDRGQRNLTPGEVVLLLVGATTTRNRRIPLYRVGEFYSHVPVSGILGKRVDPEMLNDHALARGLDGLAKTDKRKLAWDMAVKFETDYGIVSDILHLDQTKVRTYVIKPPEVPEGVPSPEFGPDKEGRTDFRLYTVNSMTDGAGIIRYIDAADGDAADPEMDLDAISFLLDNTDPERTVVVMDSKGANAKIVELADDGGLAMVTKVPGNFSSRLRDRAGLEMFLDGWGEKSGRREGHWFADMDAMTDGPVGDDGSRRPGRTMRIVPFRSEKMFADRRARIIREGKKAADKAASALRRRRFDDESSAMLAAGLVQESLLPTGHALEWSLVRTESPMPRPGRGRPPKGEVRGTAVTWSVECSPVPDEDWTDILAERDAFEVLLTNLPRPAEGRGEDGDPRHGASPETVLELYLGQYRQEHSFMLLKGRVGLNDVYFKTPSREAAMVTVLGMAAMLRNLVNHLFKRDRGMFTTFEDMAERWQSTRVRVVDGELELDGEPDQMYDVMRRLDLSEDGIIGAVSRPTPCMPAL